MKTTKYTLRVCGTNEYINGVIYGMMQCVCRDNPVGGISYPVAELIAIDEDGTKNVVNTTYIVDTTAKRLSKLISYLLYMYSGLKDFDIEVVK